MGLHCVDLFTYFLSVPAFVSDGGVTGGGGDIMSRSTPHSHGRWKLWDKVSCGL